MKRFIICMIALALIGSLGLAQNTQPASEKKPAGGTVTAKQPNSSKPPAQSAKVSPAKPGDKQPANKGEKHIRTAAEKEMRGKYLHERTASIQKMMKELDQKFMDLYSKMNRKKRLLREKIKAAHPDVRKKSSDPVVRRKQAKVYMRELYKKDEPAVKEYIKARFALDSYLMEKNPKMREYFNQLDPKLREKIQLTTE